MFFFFLKSRIHYMQYALRATRYTTHWIVNSTASDHWATNIRSIYSFCKVSPPAMSPSLATFVLVVGFLFSCSASYLKTRQVASEEMHPTISITASLVESPISSKTTTSQAILSGYFANVRYKDSLCKIPVSATFLLLNRCFQSDVATFLYVTATSSSVSTQKYFDPLCTLSTGPSVESYKDSACVDSRKIFVTPMTTFTSQVATASQRWTNDCTVVHHVNILNFTHLNLAIEY